MKKTLLLLLLNISIFHNAFSQNFCNTVTDEPSTCFFGCPTVSGQLGGFSPDTQSINTTCLGSANTQWVKIIAESDIFSMTLSSNNCPFTRRIQVEVFDENFISVSDCNEFRPTQLGRQLRATVIPGESYFVMIKEISGLNCNYEFELQGHQREIFGNTDTIQFEPGSILSSGELYLPPVAGATDYIWEPFDVNISVDSAGNRLTYTYSGVDSAMICVTPVNDCGFGNRVCAFLPYLGCPAGSKTLPGCLVECPNVSIPLSDLSSDAFMGYTLDCQTTPLARAYWFSLIADENEITIEQAQAITNSVKIQIFDRNGIPVSDCKSFGINTNSSITADSLNIGETYSVCVGTYSNSSSNAPIELNIYGSSSQYEPLPKIKFEAGSTFDSGVAYIDSSYVIDSLAWGLFQDIEIISGQGTNRVIYNNPDADAYIFLRGYTDDCGELHLQRTLLPGAVPGGNTPIPPCLPTNGGIAAGDNPPGCSLCGPIYQGSTAGYSPTAPGSGGFPCGTVENNQFISIVADGTGVFSGTVLASSCVNGQGVQLILYDQAFNPVSNCFSSGGTNLPGNVTASGLTPGETYWIMIDGFAGDICDILVTTSGGVNTSPPDPPGPMYITPDTTPLCPGAVVCYSIDPVMGASNYEWIIPGNSILKSGGGTMETEICVEYIAPGGGVVRVTPSNPCFPGIPIIEPVVVLPILPTLKPPEFVCPEDFPIVRDGNVFNDAGSHEVTYLTGLGCDSIVSYIFVPNVQVPYKIDTTICLGSCVQVGDVCYDEATSSQTIQLGPPFQQANGCDSIVILNIQIDSSTNISSDFSIDQNVCINQPINVSFSGTASSSATFDWNFNGATILSGTGGGPYQIAFPDGGAYEISLVVNESGCSSTRTSNTVVVNDRLADPFISCQTTLSSIVFSWNDILGATDYLVNVSTGQTGTLNGTEYEITGLSPNEEVQIEVAAISALGCLGSLASQTCRAQDCPPRNISIVPINKICLNQTAIPVQMTVNPPNLTGTFAWSGAGISPSGLLIRGQPELV